MSVLAPMVIVCVLSLFAGGSPGGGDICGGGAPGGGVITGGSRFGSRGLAAPFGIIGCSGGAPLGSALAFRGLSTSGGVVASEDPSSRYGFCALSLQLFFLHTPPLHTRAAFGSSTGPAASATGFASDSFSEEDAELEDEDGSNETGYVTIGRCAFGRCVLSSSELYSYSSVYSDALVSSSLCGFLVVFVVVDVVVVLLAPSFEVRPVWVAVPCCPCWGYPPTGVGA